MGAHAKQAGERMVGREVELFVDQKAPEEMEPYERLIGDAISGDSTLFAREDEVEAAWAAVDPVLHATHARCIEYDPAPGVPPRPSTSSTATAAGMIRVRRPRTWTRWPMRS